MEKITKNNGNGQNTAKKCALSAMFVALAYCVSLLEIPIFPTVGFLKLDLSFSVLMLGGYVLGPLFGEVIIAVTISLGLFKNTSSVAGVGELANFITANVFIMPPVLIYKYKKGITTVISSMVISGVLTVVVALIANRFLLFPLNFGQSAEAVFKANVYFIIIFNVIKCVANSLTTLLLYKKLKKFLAKLFE